MSESTVPAQRVRFVRTIAIAWLFFISAFTIMDHVALSQLKDKTADADAHGKKISILEQRLSAVEQSKDALEHAAPPMSAAKFDELRASLDERLTRIEQTLGNTAAKVDLTPIEDRLNKLEGRVASLKAPQNTARPQNRTTSLLDPKAAEPPFTPLGIELRGGERFLSLAPGDLHALEQVRVLRVGDTEGDWQLEGIEGKTAVFRNAGRLQRITVP